MSKKRENDIGVFDRVSSSKRSKRKQQAQSVGRFGCRFQALPEAVFDVNSILSYHECVFKGRLCSQSQGYERKNIEVTSSLWP
jgi:hypothetical protein